MKCFKARFTTNGIEKSVRKLLIDVSESDKATFPLNKCVIKPEVAPPGLAAKITKPTFISLETLAKLAIPKAINGKATIWEVKAVANAFGYKAIFVKSFSVSERPMPNIIKASTELTRISIVCMKY